MKRLLPSGCRLVLVNFVEISDSIKVDQTPIFQPSIWSCPDGVTLGDWRRVSLDVMQRIGLAGTDRLHLCMGREMPGLESDDRLLRRHRTVSVITCRFRSLRSAGWTWRHGCEVPGLKS